MRLTVHVGTVAERRALILRAAGRLFAEHGYAGLALWWIAHPDVPKHVVAGAAGRIAEGALA
jgi:hypothetical protein